MSAQEKGKKQNNEGDLVQKAMGDFGLWQFIICVALSLFKVSVAWHQLAIIFLAPSQDYWCQRPEGRDVDVDLWRNISSPQDGGRSSCFRYDASLDDMLAGNVENATVIPCSDWEFDTSLFTSTIVDSWQLVCSKEMLAHLSQTIFMFGILLGNFVFGFIADKYGRKGPMLWSIVCQIIAGTATAFTSNFIVFLVLRFIDALATGSAMVTTFVLSMEIVGPRRRALVSVMYHLPFSAGHLVLPGVSYFLRNWRQFQIAISVPSVMLLAYIWIVPESPRWLLTEGRIAEAKEIVEFAAKRNGLPTTGLMEKLEQHCKSKQCSEDNVQKGSFFDLIRFPNLRLRTLCLGFNWTVCGVCFFGLAQYAGQMGGNIFLNVAVGGMIEVPGAIVCVYLLEKLGRKKTLALAQFVSGVACLSIIFIPDHLVWPAVALANTGIVGMSIAFPTLYLYSGELFPTVVRNVGVGFSSMCARIGSMAAPFMSGLNSYSTLAPPLLFGVFPLIGSVLCLVLPETKNMPLPDTIEEGESMGKSVKKDEEVCGQVNKAYYREWEDGVRA